MSFSGAMSMLVSGRVCHWWIVFFKSNPVEVPGSFCRTFPAIGASFGAAHGRSAAAAEQSKGGDGEGAERFFRENVLWCFLDMFVIFFRSILKPTINNCENDQRKKFDAITDLALLIFY